MDMQLKGVIPPIITPLTQAEEVDREGLKNMVEYLIKGGVHGLFALGSTGEFASLDDETKDEAVRVIVEETSGRVPVLVGVTGVGTKQTLANLKRAQDLGADAVVVSPGYYYPYTDSELVRHYEILCKETNIPIMLYNVPVRVRSALNLNAIATLADFDPIIGIKDSSGSFNFVQELVTFAQDKPNFAVFQGDEQAMGAALLLGADGIVPGIGNLDPVRCVDLYNAAMDQDIKNTVRLQREINEMCKVFSLGSAYGALKGALNTLNLISPHAAEPQALPTAAQLEEIKGILVEKGLLK